MKRQSLVILERYIYTALTVCQKDIVDKAYSQCFKTVEFGLEVGEDRRFISHILYINAVALAFVMPVYTFWYKSELDIM